MMRRVLFVLTAVGIAILSLQIVPSSPGIAATVSADSTAPRAIPDGTAALWMVRSIRMDKLGLEGSVGLAYAASTNTFMLLSVRTDSPRTVFSSITLMTPHAERAGGFRSARAVSDPTNIAFDPRSRRLLMLDEDGRRLLAVRTTAAGGGVAKTSIYDMTHLGLVDPQGMAVDPGTGSLFILDAARREILRVTPDISRAGGSSVRLLRDGRLSVIDLRRDDIPDLRGLAFNPADGHLYTTSPAARALYEVTLDGEIERFIDLSSLELRDPRALVFAPSVDSTDDSAIQDLFIADGPARAAVGSDDDAPARTGGRLVEISLTPPDRIEAASSTFKASLVRTILTSHFSPPSPDPMALTYDPSSGSLVESDSEVEEMRIYAGVNVYEMSLTGSLRRTYKTKFSNEPSGVTVNTRNGHWIFADDDSYKIYDVDLGSDHTFGTSDDVVRSFSASSLGDHDPEDVVYDAVRNHLILADGDGAEIWDIAPGTNGRFDGGGDDTITHWDTARYGLRNPEGIGVNPITGNFYLSSRDAHFILETTPGGTIVTTIDSSVIPANRPSGIAFAPSSTDPSVMHLYICDRGADNDSNSSENDGRIFEITLPGQTSTGTNNAPNVDAGPDQTVVLPASASLPGSVFDDGLPAPPSLTVTWSKVSGTGSVSFGNSHAASTSASFSATGTYVLRLTATDGQLSSTDEATIVVTGTISGVGGNDTRILAGSDDAEESSSGSMSLTSSDLELVHDSTDQRVGLRFNGLAIPRGTTITVAYIQFQTDEAQSDVTALRIEGQNVDNAPTFTSSSNNISGRARTSAFVNWAPGAWTTVGESGALQRTPDLSAIVQEIVNRSGWASGNSLALILTGTGHRTAVAYEGAPEGAAFLHVETATSASNQAPVVDAGSDQTLTLPAAAALTGSASDDGRPAPASLTTTWSKSSGPGNVTFGDSHQLATSASFSASGTYVLRLTADDGAKTGTDTLTVVVNPAGSAGNTIDARVAAGADDAEENTSAAVNLSSGDLELTKDSTDQVVGMRFSGITIPRGATITAAYVQFQTDETGSGAIALSIKGQLADNAAAFTSSSANISSRSRTSATVAWSPADWSTVGAVGTDQRTPELKAIVQEIVNRSGWTSGNSLAIIITGTGHRTAVAYDGSPAGAPLLHVEYQ